MEKIEIQNLDDYQKAELLVHLNQQGKHFRELAILFDCSIYDILNYLQSNNLYYKKCTNINCVNPIKHSSEFVSDKNSVDGYTSHCKICRQIYGRKYYNRKRDNILQYWKERNSDPNIHENKLKYNQEYYNNHREERLEYMSRYQKDNPDIVRFIRSNRRATELNATPNWVNKGEIKKFYNLAVKLTLETGIKHVVDHIVPLQGKNVSGLHVPWNLQILTESENCIKSNKV